jgi:GT2 family glycosyltransferase
MDFWPNLWVVVLTYKGLDDTRRCLKSLADVAYPRLSTLVVDNHSEDETAIRIRDEFPWCHVVENPVNSGYAGGNNVGLRHALDHGADWILLLNNDTIVAPHLAARLVEAARAHPDYGILGPIIHRLDQPDILLTDGVIFNPPGYNGFFQRHPVPPSNTSPPTVVEVDIVNGCALMVSAEVVRHIGFLDERFFMYCEESDYCLRAIEAGYRCGIVADVLVWHKGGSSARPLPRYYDTRNLFLLLRKHRGAPRHGRSRLATAFIYLKHIYYRYCLEMEAGRTESASAVLEGFRDALAGCFGKFTPQPRPLVPLLRLMFELLRRRPRFRFRR